MGKIISSLSSKEKNKHKKISNECVKTDVVKLSKMLLKFNNEKSEENIIKL